MVKIPELPGNYRPGDVVNGHVLSPRGHWIPLADAPSRGVEPRRYLETQVSTMRDSNSPTRVARERPRGQGAYGAPPSATPPAPAWVPGTTTAQTRIYSPAPTVTPASAQSPAPARARPGAATPLPRVGATPSTMAPPAQRPPSDTSTPNPHPPSGPVRGGPTDTPPSPTQRSGRGRLFGIIVVVFILVQVISRIARDLPDLFGSGAP